MNRLIRMRHFNSSSSSGEYDVLFPQGITENILRSENGGVLESDLIRYDRHLEDKTVHLNHVLAEGTERALKVTLRGTALSDGLPLMVTLSKTLEAEPTLSFNGGENKQIISANGERIPGGQMADATIFLVWNESLDKWILMSTNSFVDVTKVVLPVETDYTFEADADDTQTIVIPGFNKRTDKLVVNYGQTILRFGTDYEYTKSVNNSIRLIGFGLSEGEILQFTIISYVTTAKSGHYRYELKDIVKDVEITADNTTVVPVPGEVIGAHRMVVNFNQTILRNGLDYDYDPEECIITLHNIVLSKGDVLHFVITQFVECPGELIPNNWGATGNYRYKLNVIHGSYTADTETGYFLVPEFDHRRDDISIMQDNSLLILDVDYTIDEVGGIVLLQKTLASGEEIFYTILQGAMLDVPNFNVAESRDHDGQHLLFNISHSTLCDNYVLLIKLKNRLKNYPTIKFVDGPALPVCDVFDMPITGGFRAGTYLWVVYNESKRVWFSLMHGKVDVSQLVPTYLTSSGEGEFSGVDPETGTIYETIIPHNLGARPQTINVHPCEAPTTDSDGKLQPIGDIWTHADETYLYVGNSGTSTSKFAWSVSTQDKNNDLRSYIDDQLEEAREAPGKIVPYASTYESVADGTVNIVNISNYDAYRDRLVVNLNQTILRPGIDYEIDKEHNGINLLTLDLDYGEMLQFVVLKQTDLI